MPLGQDPAQAVEEALALLTQGRHAHALDVVRHAIARNPRTPNAQNLAGFVVLQSPERTPADLETAIAYFREAHAIDPSQIEPIANLGDALVAAGKARDAVAELERIAVDRYSAAAHNWLGVYFTRSEPDLPRAKDHLEQATRSYATWGVAWLNLGWVLDQLGELDSAYAAYGRALAADNCHDLAFAHARRAVLEELKGWLRNSLRSIRHAKKAEKSGLRAAELAAFATRLEQELAARGIDFPEEKRDEKHRGWARACEDELPPEIVFRTETGVPISAALVEVELLIRATKFEAAVEALERVGKNNAGDLVDAIGMATRGAERARQAGERRAGLALLRIALGGYRIYASWSSSGAEGLGRMHDVERMQKLIRQWERES